MTEKNHIHTIASGVDGPTVAIFGGVHGDERGGVIAIQELVKSLVIKKGTVHLVLANPDAVEKNTRQVTKNLNRCFFKSNSGTTREDIRARELMDLLDSCDALLDLHNFPDPEGEPFIICEKVALDIAKRLGPEIISTGWATAEPGATDGYMFENGKIGICAECGPRSEGEKTSKVAIHAARQFLAYFGMVEDALEPAGDKQVIQATRSVIRTSEDFYLDPSLHNFQLLPEGKVFGHDGAIRYIGGKGEHIIFPWPDALVGAEAYIVGVNETS